MYIYSSLYICHYCIDYKTKSKKDMDKHFNRKNKCNCNTILSYDECKTLTLNKKYYFCFDHRKLIRNDFIKIINLYVNKENYIYENYDDINIIKLCNNFTYNKNNLSEEDSDNELEEKEEKDEKDDNEDEFDKLYFNKEINKYKCSICGSEYTSKQNMKKHVLNPKQCDSKKKLYDMMELSKNKMELILKKKEELHREEQLHIFNQNIQNLNQSLNQNIQNYYNSNIQNNSNQNNFNFALKDFVNDRYDISHIKDSFYEKKDFFLYPNFLNMIMENEKNQNIFFSNNEAIIYTDNELNKMSSDKAGYLILDKLSQSFSQIFYQQDDETRDYYAFINKYYNVLKGQYKHDTIFKEYDIDKQQFYYTANSNLFRSRDKYLNKIVSTINKYNGNIRKNMNITIQDIKDIPIMNPNIEDFASIKMRYRDLKDKD